MVTIGLSFSISHESLILILILMILIFVLKMQISKVINTLNLFIICYIIMKKGLLN